MMEIEKKELNKGLSVEEIKELREKKVSDLNAQQKAELMRNLSIRERLERKLQTDEVKLFMNDDLGEFSLRFRKLSPMEHNKLVMLQSKIANSKNDPEIIDDLMKQLYSVMGDVSLDGLDEQYWKEGTGYSPDILLASLLKVMSESSVPDEGYLNQIHSFR